MGDKTIADIVMRGVATDRYLPLEHAVHIARQTAAGLAYVVPWWAALLIVGGVLVLLTALLLFLALRSIRSGAPPVPDAFFFNDTVTTETVRASVAD